MRSWLHPGLLLAVSLATVAGVGADPPPFKALYDAHQWFKLRDAVAAASDAPQLYRGAVAYAFHDPAGAEKALRRVIDASPRSDEAIEARGMLISVAQMNGDYRRALAEIRALQAIVPEPGGLDNGAAFFSALAAFPSQTVSTARAVSVRSSVRGGNLFIPVSINGKPADCIVDTGANFSVMSEGDARRLGLTIGEASGSHGTDAAGSSVPFRVALAERLSVGAFELRNVAFLVARDDQQPFVDLPPGSRAVLGIPVLLAFDALRWHAEGRFEVEVRTPPGARRDANLCFDGADLHAAALYRGTPVDMFVDIGATKSRLTATFARDFPEAVRNAKISASTIRGVGGSATINVAVLENVTLRVGGRDLVLHSVETLQKNLEGRSDRFHVWAGFDLFSRTRAVTIDFRSMKLAVD